MLVPKYYFNAHKCAQDVFLSTEDIFKSNWLRCCDGKSVAFNRSTDIFGLCIGSDKYAYTVSKKWCDARYDLCEIVAKRNVAIHTPTKEAAISLLTTLSRLGLSWCDGTNIRDKHSRNITTFFNIYDENTCYKISDEGLSYSPYTYYSGFAFIQLLEFKDIDLPNIALDAEELEYLCAVLKPYKDEIYFVQKHKAKCTDEYALFFYTAEREYVFRLPYFEINSKMYKGMKSELFYNIEELGLLSALENL